MTIAERGVEQPLGHLPDDLHLLPVLNRYSSNYPLALAQLDKLVELKYVSRDDVLETLPTRTETGLYICDRLTAGESSYNAVIVLAGDGTVNTAATSMHESGDEFVLTTPLVAGKGGGACDGHYATQGDNPGYLEDLPGQPVYPDYPINIYTAFRDNREFRHEKAWFHVGIGLDAEIAFDVNGSLHRDSWLLNFQAAHRPLQYLTALGSLLNARRFYMRANDGPWRTTYEHPLIKGTHMGGFDKFPGELTSRSYKEIDADRFMKVLRYGGRLLRNKEVAFEDRTSSGFHVAPRRKGQMLYLQFDGETIDLTTGREAIDDTPSPAAYIRTVVDRNPLGIAAPALAPHPGGYND